MRKPKIDIEDTKETDLDIMKNLAQ